MKIPNFWVKWKDKVFCIAFFNRFLIKVNFNMSNVIVLGISFGRNMHPALWIISIAFIFFSIDFQFNKPLKIVFEQGGIK